MTLAPMRFLFLLHLALLAPEVRAQGAPLETALDRARQALLAADLEAARAALDNAQEQAAGLKSPVEPQELARYWYYLGVVEQREARGEDFFEKWRTSLAIDSRLPWDPPLVEDDSLGIVFDALRVEGEQRRKVPARLSSDRDAYVDGRPAEADVFEGVHLVQFRCEDGGLVGTWSDFTRTPDGAALCRRRAGVSLAEGPMLSVDYADERSAPVVAPAPTKPPRKSQGSIQVKSAPAPMPEGLSVVAGPAGALIARVGVLPDYTPIPVGGAGLHVQGAWDLLLGPGMALRGALGLGAVGWPAPADADPALESILYGELRPRFVLATGKALLSIGPTWRVARSSWVGVDCPACAEEDAEILEMRTTRQLFGSAGMGVGVGVPLRDQLWLEPSMDLLFDGVYLQGALGVGVGWRP